MQEARAGSHWMLTLEEGDDLFPTLSTFASRRGLRAASIEFGIGMFRAASVGYWNGQEYEALELTEAHEVISLHGSIAEVDGTPSLHLHAGLANKKHELVGGHLLKATIGIVLEVSIHAFDHATFARPFDESVGLRRLDLGSAAHGP